MSQLLPVLFGFMIDFPCEMTPVAPEEYPTAEEMLVAAAFVGATSYPTVAVVPGECMTEEGFVAEGLYYPGYSLMILAEGWRERNEGITILVHEMQHHQDDVSGAQMSE